MDAKRAIRVHRKDGTCKDLDLSKATVLKGVKGMMHLDQIKDDTWRLTFSEEFAKDFSEIISMEIIRQ